ncbi:MAG: phospho-N-acetylmuramoyl-pentapeptide-transferase [Thermodesulfobacteriota bacterium]|nr:phospho-N-acetylmuramoyl-pentapeptide-transferase [Thermodesulfobacteriota bacterium]
MLFHLLYPLEKYYFLFNVFHYITFRTIYATVTALFLSLVFGSFAIRTLKHYQINECIREDGPETHNAKKGTPTMGGILILGSLLTATLLWVDLENSYIWLVIFTTVSLGILGLIDDYTKVIKKDPKGLTVKEKLFYQTIIGLTVGLFLYFQKDFPTTLAIPFFKNVNPDLGIFYILFATVLIVGSSNAVNLSDGLDGLAIGLILIVTTTYMLFSYITGHIKIAQYLQISYIAGSGELSIFCGALIGAGLGFLWYNAYPAQIFMGDVSSLALGGSLGCIALITNHEIVLSIVGGIFVIEALSVIGQVLSFKTRKKRILLMAPIHHHFELKGLKEPKIVVRFWIVGVLLALLAISTLKLR